MGVQNSVTKATEFRIINVQACHHREDVSVLGMYEDMPVARYLSQVGLLPMKDLDGPKVYIMSHSWTFEDASLAKRALSSIMTATAGQEVIICASPARGEIRAAASACFGDPP